MQTILDGTQRWNAALYLLCLHCTLLLLKDLNAGGKLCFKDIHPLSAALFMRASG